MQTGMQAVTSRFNMMWAFVFVILAAAMVSLVAPMSRAICDVGVLVVMLALVLLETKNKEEVRTDLEATRLERDNLRIQLAGAQDAHRAADARYQEASTQLHSSASALSAWDPVLSATKCSKPEQLQQHFTSMQQLLEQQGSDISNLRTQLTEAQDGHRAAHARYQEASTQLRITTTALSAWDPVLAATQCSSPQQLQQRVTSMQQQLEHHSKDIEALVNTLLRSDTMASRQRQQQQQERASAAMPASTSKSASSFGKKLLSKLHASFGTANTKASSAAASSTIGKKQSTKKSAKRPSKEQLQAQLKTEQQLSRTIYRVLVTVLVDSICRTQELSQEVQQAISGCTAALAGSATALKCLDAVLQQQEGEAATAAAAPAAGVDTGKQRDQATSRTPPAALPSSAPELLQKQPKDNQHKEESATNTTTTAATSSSSRSSILSTLRAEAAQHQEHVRSLGLQLSNERDNGASLAQALAATQERLEAAVARAVCAEGEAANRQQHLALLQEQVAGMQGRLGGEEADGDEEEGEAVFEFV